MGPVSQQRSYWRKTGMVTGIPDGQKTWSGSTPPCSTGRVERGGPRTRSRLTQQTHTVTELLPRSAPVICPVDPTEGLDDCAYSAVSRSLISEGHILTTMRGSSASSTAGAEVDPAARDPGAVVVHRLRSAPDVAWWSWSCSPQPVPSCPARTSPPWSRSPQRQAQGGPPPALAGPCPALPCVSRPGRKANHPPPAPPPTPPPPPGRRVGVRPVPSRVAR